MLNILERNAIGVRLSLHEMFLSAPEEVLLAIVAYVKRSRKDRQMHNKRLKEYINLHYDNYHYEKSLPTLRTKGQVYDLEELMKDLNQEYFDGKLQLAITWFKGRGGRRRILFGKYEQSMRLVRISDSLDVSSIPMFFVRYIIYHEMVHSVVQSKIDECGRCRMHGPEFKTVEKRFKEYAQAREWEKNNKEQFFGRT
jgi:hypothetical protein